MRKFKINKPNVRNGFIGSFFLASLTLIIFSMTNQKLYGVLMFLGIFGTHFVMPKSWRTCRILLNSFIGSYYLYDQVSNGNFFFVELDFFQLFLMGTVSYSIVYRLSVALIGTRGFCGYICPMTALLDFLPWSVPTGRVKKYYHSRYYVAAVLALILSLVYFLGFEEWFYVYRKLNIIVLYISYIFIGIFLARKFKDNKAICKYFCPIGLAYKIPSIISFFRITLKKETCTRCMLCETYCPMDIKLVSYMDLGKRVDCTECISCKSCIAVCPHDSISFTPGFSISTGDLLNIKKTKAIENN